MGINLLCHNIFTHHGDVTCKTAWAGHALLSSANIQTIYLMNASKTFLRFCLLSVCLTGMIGSGVSSSQAQVAVPVTRSVTTYMFDNYQSGINPNESILTPNNVKTGTFGALFTSPIDGAAYAQPLYLWNLTVGGVKHNVAYVATMHDSVYAFDADTGTQLWKTSFISPNSTDLPLITTVPNTDFPGSGNSDIDGPEVGIVSTPVIDESTGTIYVVAKTKETGRGDGNIHYVQRLHALDVATGAEKFAGPKIIGDTTCNASTSGTATYDFNLADNPQTPSVPGTGDNTVNGNVYFNALRNNQRCSLTLSNGAVYVAWASHGDSKPYHGWLVGFDANTLLPIPRLVFCDTPAGSQGGIWQSGAGPTIDNSGNLFISTANAGASFCANQTAGNIAESFIKFNPTNGLSVTAAGFDFWAPGDAPGLGNADSGVGSGGLVLMDVPGTIPHLCMAGGKNGKIYVVNRDNMGGFVNAGGDRDIQTFTFSRTFYFGSPVFFNNNLFFDGNTIQGFTFNPTGSTFTASGSASYGFSGRGAGFVISANGTTNGIIWSFSTGVLKAIRPESIAGPTAQTNVSEFYQTPLGDRSTVKFTHPIVINGKVYAANKTAFLGYGLLNVTKPTVTVAATQPTATVGQSPGQFTVTRSGSTVGNLFVTYAVSGTAQSGTGYTALSGTVTIPDGAASATVAVNAQSGAQSNTTVILTVSSNANYTVGGAQQATVTILSGFDAWRTRYFGGQANSPSAAPAADFDSDGIANLLEYSFGTDPTVPQSGPSYAVTVQGGKLKVSFTRSLQTDNALTIEVDASDTLASGSWTPLATKVGGNAWATSAGVIVTDDPGTSAVTVTDSQVISGQSKRFLRISVGLNAN